MASANQKKQLLERKKNLIKWLKEHQVEGCLIQDPVNLLYYTGIKISTGILFISEKRQVLMVDHRYYERCKKEVPLKVEATKNFKESLKAFNLPAKIAVDNQCIFLKDHELYSQFAEVVSYSGFLMQKRMVKDADEIKLIKKSCDITKKGFAYIQKHLKEGVTEAELAKRLEIYLLESGAEKMAFDPIIAFGKNAANPHYTPQKVKLKKNDLILIDAGSVYQNYHSDMTRTYIKGKISEKMQKLIELTKLAQREAIKICKPKVTVRELNECVQAIFKEHQVESLFIHGLGHGVGLEIHEGPSLGLFANPEMTLEEGMVITIEPGLYVPDLGGVRIEDSILITATGNKNLTA